MAAKEMFEDCGYELREKSARFIDYERDLNYYMYYEDLPIYSICFDLKDKTILFDEMEVDVDLFKAINMQLSELGWVDV